MQKSYILIINATTGDSSGKMDNITLFQFGNVMAMDKTGLPVDCMTYTNQYSTECIYQTICGQLNHWFLVMGILIILLWLVMSWLKWYFFRFGYKKILRFYDPTSAFWKYVGNLEYNGTRIYWDIWLDRRLTKFMLGYIVVMLWLNLR